jgi:hypothetical protein
MPINNYARTAGTARDSPYRALRTFARITATFSSSRAAPASTRHHPRMRLHVLGVENGLRVRTISAWAAECPCAHETWNLRL